jgi:hypothetical protein
MHPKTRKILQLLRLRQVGLPISIFTIVFLLFEFVCLIVYNFSDLQWCVPEGQQGYH